MADRSVALIVGANRGLGLGLTREWLRRGHGAIATARQPDKAAELTALAQSSNGRLLVEALDLDDAAQVDAFPGRLAGRRLDLLLLNAGVAGPEHRNAQQATPAEIGALMYTNAIAPIRLARALAPQLRDDGVIAFMSSRMGSVALNTDGGHELYRASKAALNSLTRSLAAALASRKLTLLTLHPGWVRTDMGGPNAALDVETSVHGLADVLERAKGTPGHRFFDYSGQELAW